MTEQEIREMHLEIDRLLKENEALKEEDERNKKEAFAQISHIITSVTEWNWRRLFSRPVKENKKLKEENEALKEENARYKKVVGVVYSEVKRLTRERRRRARIRAEQEPERFEWILY